MKKVLIILLFIIVVAIIACLIIKNLKVAPTEEVITSGEPASVITDNSGEREVISNEVVEYKKEFEFTDELYKTFADEGLLAIADIREATRDDFINKYFNVPEQYNGLNRYNLSNNTLYQNTLVIIPRNENVKYDICSCKINDEGEVLADYVVFENIAEPMIFTFDDYESITPQNCIRIQTEGFERIVPIVYSGMDGHLAFGDAEDIIKDISVYDD